MRTTHLVAAGLVAVLAMSDAAAAVQNRGAARAPQAAPPRAMRAAPRAAPRVVSPAPARPTRAQDARAPGARAAQDDAKADASVLRAAKTVTRGALPTMRAAPVDPAPAVAIEPPPSGPSGVIATRRIVPVAAGPSPEEQQLYKARAARTLESMEPWQQRAMARNHIASQFERARRTGQMNRAARAAETRRAARDEQLVAQRREDAAARLAELDPWQMVAMRRNEIARRHAASQRSGQVDAVDKVVLAKSRWRDAEAIVAPPPPPEPPHVPNSLSVERLGSAGELRFSQPHTIYRNRADATARKAAGGN